MSSAERDFLAGILSASANRLRRWKQAAGNAVVLFAASLLAFVVVWAAVAWLFRRTIGPDYGWESSAAIWVAMAGAALCAVFAVTSTVRWVKSWPDHRAELRTDLSRGIVVDEFYRLVEVKRFQEPEHGGLIYFLRNEDDRVLVLYDSESASLGAAGEDPLGSPFRPSSELTMVRAPATRFVLDTRFAGSAMTLSAPIELAVQLKEWPDQDEFCAISWDNLETHFGPKSA
jgi:hypothetical protein